MSNNDDDNDSNVNNTDNIIDLSWVPQSCRLYLTFDGIARKWYGALRLRCDYLGYLVSEVSASTPEETINLVWRSYMDGMRRLDEYVQSGRTNNRGDSFLRSL